MHPIRKLEKTFVGNLKGDPTQSQSPAAALKLDWGTRLPQGTGDRAGPAESKAEPATSPAPSPPL